MPGTITIGADPINRGAAYGAGYTLINETGRARAAGIITLIEIYADTPLTGVEVAFFRRLGDTVNRFTTSSTVSLGNVAAGYTSHVVNMAVEVNEYIGIYMATGNVDRDSIGSYGYWYLIGDNIPCTDTAFTFTGTRVISLRGTGPSSGGGGVGGGAKQLVIGTLQGAINGALTTFTALYGGSSAWEFNPFAEDNIAQLSSLDGVFKNLFIELSGPVPAGRTVTFTLMENNFATALSVTLSPGETQGSDLVNTAPISAGDRFWIQCVSTADPGALTAHLSCEFHQNLATGSLLPATGATNTGANRYLPIMGGFGAEYTTGVSIQRIIPTNGKIRKLMVRMGWAAGAAPDAYRFTLVVNGIATALTCTITAPNLTGSDLVNEVNVIPGDYVYILIEPLNAPAGKGIVWSCMEFVPVIKEETLLLGGSQATLGPPVFKYIVSPESNDPTNEAGANQGGHSGFTLKKFFVRLDPPLGGVGRSLTFRIRKNIADTGIEVVITDPDVSGNDVVHSTNLADYDLICVSVPSGFPGVSQGEWGLVSYSPSGIPTGEIQNKMVAAGLI